MAAQCALDAHGLAEAQELALIEQRDLADRAEPRGQGRQILVGGFGVGEGAGDDSALPVDQEDLPVDAGGVEVFPLHQLFEAVLDGLEVEAEAVFDAHAQVTSREVVGDDVGGGQVGEGVVALGQIGRQGIGPPGQLETGPIDEVLFEAPLHVQVVDEQRDRVDDEEQQGREALAVAFQAERLGGHRGCGAQRAGDGRRRLTLAAVWCRGVARAQGFRPRSARCRLRPMVDLQF
ncbi:hypothetical protein [Zoogloea ramigera]|uniref:hypothetical protein n=1 Tax=Zoogloea ramigera TaxID=350 RepID=UPI003FA1E9D2